MSNEIRSATELDALPVGSVVIDKDGDCWQRSPRGWGYSEDGECETSHALIWAPYFVIYRPDRDLIADAYAQGGRDALTAAAEAIRVEMRRHDGAQTGFSAIGDAYAEAARIVERTGADR